MTRQLPVGLQSLSWHTLELSTATSFCLSWLDWSVTSISHVADGDKRRPVKPSRTLRDSSSHHSEFNTDFHQTRCNRYTFASAEKLRFAAACQARWFCKGKLYREGPTFIGEIETKLRSCWSIQLWRNSKSCIWQPRTSYQDQSTFSEFFQSKLGPNYRSSAHSFSFLICASSSGVKSLTMLKSLRISSGCLPLIMLATDLHPTSNKGLMSK